MYNPFYELPPSVMMHIAPIAGPSEFCVTEKTLKLQYDRWLPTHWTVNVSGIEFESIFCKVHISFQISKDTPSVLSQIMVKLGRR